MLGSQSVLVVGAGESGLAMAQWCASQGACVRIADSRAEPPGIDASRALLPMAQFVLGSFSENLLDGVDLLALSPGIDVREALIQTALRRNIPVVGEMALFARALDMLGVRDRTRILAVTGTNGKTTTTALAATLCQAAGYDAVAAGNISPAALAVLTQRLNEGQALPACWVLELSSFQLEHAQGFAADAAVVLNVSEDHLDRHEDVTGYAAIKARIFDGGGVQVLNRQNDQVMRMARADRRIVTFGQDSPPGEDDFGLVRDDEGAVWLAHGAARLVRADALAMAGAHNLLNAQAALALASQVAEDGDRVALVSALRAFRGLPHRVEAIARRSDGVVFYDDSKGTNVGATQAALTGLGRRAVLIAGGIGKGQDFSVLREAVARHAAAVVLIGRDAPLIESALEGANVAVEHAADMDDAVTRASRLATADMLVLLSPACASFDMFRSYAHRAEMFRDAVLRLPGVSGL